MSQPDNSNDLRVLAVDDHPMMLDTLVGLLVDLDPPREVDVLTAATGAETFRCARDDRPLDLILLDLKLEGDLGARDGIARLRSLRGMRPATPVVVFSEYGDKELVADA